MILVRKIGVPGRSELAMGALAMVGGEIAEFRNQEIIDGLRISSQAFEAARNRERVELERRASLFPSAELDIADATVILVDDGLATGSTMLAAVAAVRTHRPAGGRRGSSSRSSPGRAGTAISGRPCHLSLDPEPFIAVGGAYEDFRQLSDEEVLTILKEFSL